VNSAPDLKAIIYFVFAFMSWLKGAFDMVKGNRAQNVVPRHGEELNSFGWFTADKMPVLMGKFNADLLKCVCFKSCDGSFVHGFEEDRPKTAKNDHE